MAMNEIADLIEVRRNLDSIIQRIIGLTETSKVTIDQLNFSKSSIPRRLVPADQPTLIVSAVLSKRGFDWVCVSKNSDQRRHVLDFGIWPESSNISDMFPDVGSRRMAKLATERFLSYVESMRWIDQTGKSIDLDEIRLGLGWGGATEQMREVIDSRNKNVSEFHLICRSENQTGIDEWVITGSESRSPGLIRKPGKIMIDANYWKTETHIAVEARDGEHGSLSFFDGDCELIFESILSEDCELKIGIRTLEMWTCSVLPPNSLFSCLIAAIA
jgi:hypothetical protein